MASGFVPQGAAQDPAPKTMGEPIIVKLPRPRFHGGREFLDNVPKRDATFAWSEICATPGPECSLAPVPQVPAKQWYNTYVYVPEQRSHVQRHFLERYVQGPDGEWLDVVKARRMAGYLEEHRRKAAEDEMERELVANGSSVQNTGYVDAYSGEPLRACKGQLIPQSALNDQYKLHRSEWKDFLTDQAAGWDFDNLRVAWPFGRPDRNKKISAHAYEWFDRQNPFIPTDRSYEMLELPSMYVDKENYMKWRPVGGDSPTEFMQDVSIRAQYSDDYPYVL